MADNNYPSHHDPQMDDTIQFSLEDLRKERERQRYERRRKLSARMSNNGYQNEASHYDEDYFDREDTGDHSINDSLNQMDTPITHAINDMDAQVETDVTASHSGGMIDRLKDGFEEVKEKITKENILEELEDDLPPEVYETVWDQPGPVIEDQAIAEGFEQEHFQDLNQTGVDTQSANEAGDTFVGGATWLTIGNIISRVLGAIYVIPWATWLGQEYTQANTLYSVGYKPYSLFLAIATAGFPSAIAKQMAFFHSKQEYRVADKLFKYSLSVMLITGVISGGLLFGLAPTLAYSSSTVNPDGAIIVIRSLVPALIILPVMSLLRGYFQGFNDMKPTAISQILEQIARVVYMLVATYAIMRVYNGTATMAVVHSTFAAFVGALLALIYLVIVYLRHLPRIKQMVDHSADRIDVNFRESLKLMVQDSIPFILLGSGIIIVQLIDTYTFSQILSRSSDLLMVEISELYGALSLDVDKLMMIIVSLAVSLATAAVPAVTSHYASGDKVATGELVHKIVTVFLAVMLPAALGMAAVSKNVYTFFYANGSLAGPGLLITGSVSSIALGAYTVFSTILQSMNYRRVAVKYLLMAIAIKLLLQYPMVALFKGHGALIGTMLAFIISSILMWTEINKHLSINQKRFMNDTIGITVASLLMFVFAFMWNLAIDRLFGPVGRLLTFVKVLLVMLIGVAVYVVSLGIFGKLSILVGDRLKRFQELLQML